MREKNDDFMVYSYVVRRDFGFAPNPFYGILTLATCKPRIRGPAEIGDWVIGTAGKSNMDIKYFKKLIFAMKVTAKVNFNEYYNDLKYYNKKPVMNGSLMQMYGDNIYHCESGKWIQSDSHHSKKDGLPNEINLENDTSSPYVLISDDFYYFGKNAIKIKKELEKCIHEGENHISKKIPSQLRKDFVKWIRSMPKKGYIDDPILFSGEYKRFSGN